MENRHFVTINDISVGMKIDQAILDNRGRVVIAKETTLTQANIDYLREIQLSGIYIREGQANTFPMEEKSQAEVSRIIRQERKNDPPIVELSSQVREHVSTSISYIFNDLESPDLVSVANDISANLFTAITKNEAIAFNIDALKICDEYTFSHSVEVATIAMIIATQMGYSKEEVYAVGLSGLLHDIGKFKIPNDILNKPTSLTDSEFDIMKKHPVYSYHLLQDKPGINQKVLLGILQHHEKLNGHGYPMGVQGDKIHNYARIVAVADIFDALVSKRPYKQPFTKRDATEMIIAMTGELDIDVIRSFLNSVILYPVDSVVSLSNHEEARVVKNIAGFPLRPVVVGLTTGNVYDLSNDPKCTSIIIE